MAIHWDYDQIARSARHYWLQQGRRSGVTPEDVRRDIQGHRALWNGILSTGTHVNPQSAYMVLRDVLEGRRDRESATYRTVQYGSPEADLFAGVTRTGIPGAVPDWLVQEARYHLAYLAAHPGSHSAPRVAPASFTLWLAIHAYEDEGLGFIKRRLRTRWRISGDYYEWLVRLLRAERQLRDVLARRGVLREGADVTARQFGEPLGPRDPAGYAPGRLQVFGLPLADYRTDLAEVARLLGGRPDSERWQEWAEAWLWDFPESTVPAGLPDDVTRLSGELRRSWSTPIAPSLMAGKLRDGKRILPGHTLLIAPSARPEVTNVTIRLTSRWTSLSAYPKELQALLYLQVLALWHRYDEPRSSTELVADLCSLLEPLPTPEQALEALWEAEDELLALPSKEQQRREQQARNTVRKALQRRASFLT